MEMLNYIAGGVVGNQRDIRRLNKHVTALAKGLRRTNNGVACACLGAAMMGLVIYANIKDIELLQKQVKELTREVEELKEQKGA